MPTADIYYADGSVVICTTKQEWQSAPNSGVQVVVVRDPPPEPFPVPDRFLTGIVGCNRLKPNATFFTGVDEYSFPGSGQRKTGSLIDRAAYDAIWDRAFGDH